MYACATHGILATGESAAVGLFEEVIVTNTIPVPEDNRFGTTDSAFSGNLLGKQSGDS